MLNLNLIAFIIEFSTVFAASATLSAFTVLTFWPAFGIFFSFYVFIWGLALSRRLYQELG